MEFNLGLEAIKAAEAQCVRLGIPTERQFSDAELASVIDGMDAREKATIAQADAFCAALLGRRT